MLYYFSEIQFMTRHKILLFFFLNIITLPVIYSRSHIAMFPASDTEIFQDTIPDNQVLFNGQLWINLFYMVKEDQFLFSKDFLQASLTMKGQTFTNVNIRYDIYNDEIQMPLDSGRILQINKEMVDSFSLPFQNKVYQFIRIPNNNLSGPSGYVNIIYKGKSALEVKYLKKIDRPKIEGKEDNFYQLNRVYFVKDGLFYQVKNKKDLYSVLREFKKQLRDYMKKNKIRVSKNLPESFIPVIRYYDSISR
jgi:hypothetical protein